MSALVDTDVLIDVLRGVDPAKAWLEEMAEEEFFIPGYAAMELVAGCRNKHELNKCLRFLDAFEMAWASAPESNVAFDYLVSYRLSDGLGIPDCLIAALAKSKSFTLYTFNARHFRVIPGLDVREPYHR